MSTPIKGSFLPDLASLLGVPQPQRMEPLRVVPSLPRGAERGPQTLGPQDQLDSLVGLLWPPRSEPRPARTRPSAPAVKVSSRTGTPPRDGPCCQGWSCGGPHAHDTGEQGGMPTSLCGDSPGGPASRPLRGGTRSAAGRPAPVPSVGRFHGYSQEPAGLGLGLSPGT